MEDIASKIQSVLNDEESMRQLSELADMLGLGNNMSPPENDTADTQASTDMAKAMSIINMINQAKSDDNNIVFLSALRPLLNESTRPRVDKAIKLLRLLNILPALKELEGDDLFGIF